MSDGLGITHSGIATWLMALVVISLLVGCSGQPQSAPLSAFDTGIGSDAWAQVPAGVYLYGQHEKEVTEAPPYEVMITDVTNAQFARYLNDALAESVVRIEGDRIVGHYPGDPFHSHQHEEKIDAGDWLHVPLGDPSLRLTYDGQAFGVRPGYEEHPMTVVTWFGAKAYCEFHGWRLPSEAEWEKAARGTDSRPFPWGETLDRYSANFYASRDPFEAVAGKQGDTTPVGFYNGRVYNGFQTQDARTVPTVSTTWRATSGSGSATSLRGPTIAFCAAGAKTTTVTTCASGRATAPAPTTTARAWASGVRDNLESETQGTQKALCPQFLAPKGHAATGR